MSDDDAAAADDAAADDATATDDVTGVAAAVSDQSISANACVSCAHLMELCGPQRVNFVCAARWCVSCAHLLELRDPHRVTFEIRNSSTNIFSYR